MTTWAVKIAWLITAALALVGFALIVAARRDLAGPGGDFIFNPLAGLRRRVVRVDRAADRRPRRNVIGWTLWLSGLFISLQTFSSVHPVVGLETHPSSLTASRLSRRSSRRGYSRSSRSP
jgi:hypothetical protein